MEWKKNASLLLWLHQQSFLHCFPVLPWLMLTSGWQAQQGRSAGVALLWGICMRLWEASLVPLHTSLTWENQQPPRVLILWHQQNTQWSLDAELHSLAVSNQKDSSPVKLSSVVSTGPTVNYRRISAQSSFQISHGHWGTSAHLHQQVIKQWPASSCRHVQSLRFPCEVLSPKRSPSHLFMGTSPISPTTLHLFPPTSIFLLGRGFAGKRGGL